MTGNEATCTLQAKNACTSVLFRQTLANKYTVFNAHGFSISQASLMLNDDSVVREKDIAVTILFAVSLHT